MKRNISLVISLALLTGLVWVIASGRETAVAYNNQPSRIITAAPTTATIDDATAWRHKETFGVTEEPYIIDTNHHDGPYGVMVDAGDNVWVTEIDGSRVLKFNKNGDYQHILGQTGIKRGWGIFLAAPISTAVDGSGNSWVIDRETHRVVKYDSAGNYVLHLGEGWNPGSDNTHFDYPHGVAVDSSDNVFVAERNNHRIQIFNNSGVYLATIGVTGAAGSDNAHLDSPVLIYIDNTDKLYVADRGNERVQIFDVSNPVTVTLLGTLGTTGEPGTDNAHFNGPYGVTAVNGKIYVADLSNHRVQIFNAGTYAYLATLGGSQGSGNNQFSWPIDVAVDSSGTIYVADIGNERVQLFNNIYNYVRTMGVTGIPYETDENHYYLPFHADATKDGGWLVAEKDGHRVIKLNSDGTQALTIGEPGISGDDNTHLYWPHDVAEHSNGDIYIIDSGNQRLARYRPDGSYLGQLGGYDGGFGSGNYQFDWPLAVAFGQSGDILVVDANNRRVQIYDHNFIYKATLGTTGETGNDNAHFEWPLDVVVDANGYIYVADEGNNRIQVFNSSYVYQKTLGITGVCGNDNAHFCGPHALDFDDQDRLYVADSWNQRIQIFDAAGNYLDTIGGSWGGGPGQFRSPQGVAVSKTGQVLVSDSENHRLQVFEPFENIWTQANSYGFGNSKNSMVSSLEVWGDSLFAAASNWEKGGSIWWYDPDMSAWTQVSEPGFSSTYANTNAVILDMALFKNQLYASTGWADPLQQGQLWRSNNGTSWSPVSTNGFGNSNNIALAALGEYDGYLYLGTHNEANGTEIWRSQSGNPGQWVKVLSGGGGNTNNHLISSFLEFNGYFYASFENVNEGMNIWRTSNGLNWTQVSINGFGDANNIYAGGLGKFDGYLYIGTRNNTTGAQLWRSSNGTIWHQVIGDGFGDLNNTKIDSAVSFNNALYVATYNDATGMEVWRSDDGLNFVQVNRDGFDGNNMYTLWSSGTAVYQNKLYLGTKNMSDDAGGGVWVSGQTQGAFLPIIIRNG